MGARGEITVTQIVELLLAAGAIVVLILLFVGLFDFGAYSGPEAAAESYFKTLMEQVDVASNLEIGEFQVWNFDPDENPVSLVYFGDQINHAKFSSFGENENHLCMCYREKGDSKPACKACKNLDLPVHHVKGRLLTSGEPFAVEGNNMDNVEIRREEGRYVFSFS